jgi:uncharacterized RDD family membrane protein YckC
MGPAASGVVTPEAVRLEFENANLASRILALLLDMLIQFVAVVLIVVAGVALVSGIGVELPEWVAGTLVALAIFAITWGYPTAFETVWRGRTPGKAANGLRVVTTEGAPIRFRHAAIRAALTPIDFWITAGGIAVAFVLLTSRQQRLGDLVAGTLVLRERTAAGTVAPIRFAVPPGSEGYARTVDPGGLSADDYAAIRSFLTRASSLDPQARTQLGTALAQRLAAKLAHTPPAGVSPELFLLVAAARYQARFDAPGHAPPQPSGPPPGYQEPRPPQPPAPSPPPRQDRGSFAPPS